MKKQYDKVKNLQKQLKEAMRELDKKTEEKYGFNYSDTDDDLIIDTLEYGNNDIPFEEFDRRMKKYKKHYDTTGNFNCNVF